MGHDRCKVEDDSDNTFTNARVVKICHILGGHVALFRCQRQTANDESKNEKRIIIECNRDMNVRTRVNRYE